MTTISLEHVTKTFDRSNALESKTVVAVDDVSLKIASGDVLAILGPSGCGKSTLLRLVAGIFKPDAGRVLYDDVNLQDIPIRDRGVGMVFQEGALVPHWEARRSVGFFLELRKREQEIPEKLRQISKITGIGLDTLLARRPGQLSGGEQQRVGIARALSRDMRVLLFDEPFANLDAKYRAEARVELKRLLNAFPVTSIYVTHDQIEAIALSHRIAVMKEGKIEQVGTFQQLHDNPINLFVATFIGTPPMNLFRGHIENGAWHGENFGGYPVRKDLADGTKVTAGIRPEAIHLSDEGTYGVVEQVMPFFAERHHLITVHLAGEQWSLMAPLDRMVEVGSTIRCAFDPAGLLFFDTKTGQRIG
ncbi:MAG: ABC transporter ATP-binding protein [Chloroflexi bacterium]|nr:ABC transporter ATP-binding protein [Chloroflexota bacterium]